MSKIYQGAVELIGNTPLVEVINLEQQESLKARVLVKLEYLNPAGSVKDRIAKAMLEDAEQNAPAPAPVQNKPDAIPGVTRGAAGLNAEPPRKDSYASGLEMLFGRKWRRTHHRLRGPAAAGYL